MDKLELELALVMALVFNLLVTLPATAMPVDEMGNPNQVEMPFLLQTQADVYRSRSTIARRPHGQAAIFNLDKFTERNRAITRVNFS